MTKQQNDSELIVPIELLLAGIEAEEKYGEAYKAMSAIAERRGISALYRDLPPSPDMIHYSRKLDQLRQQIGQIAKEWVIAHGIQDDRNAESEFFITDEPPSMFAWTHYYLDPIRREDVGGIDRLNEMLRDVGKVTYQRELRKAGKEK